jgi:hypothetical protein
MRKSIKKCCIAANKKTAINSTVFACHKIPFSRWRLKSRLFLFPSIEKQHNGFGLAALEGSRIERPV